MNKEILISASFYKQKYYENPDFSDLPEEIKKEIKQLCIITAENLQSIITLGFYPDGDVFIEAAAEEYDFDYDEIGVRLELKEIEQEYGPILEKLRLWYVVYRTDYGEQLRENYFK